MRSGRCSNSSYVTLYRQPAPLFSNDSGSITVLLRTHFEVESIFSTLYFLVWDYSINPQDVWLMILFFLSLFLHLDTVTVTWTTSFHTMERKRKTEKDWISEKAMYFFQFQGTVTTYTTLIKTVLGTELFFLTSKPFLRRENAINSLFTTEKCKLK